MIDFKTKILYLNHLQQIKNFSENKYDWCIQIYCLLYIAALFANLYWQALVFFNIGYLGLDRIKNDHQNKNIVSD